MIARPNGKRPMLIGKLALAAGVVGYALPMLTHPTHDIIALVALLSMLLGGLAWMVGYVVYAISFLPGRSE